MNPLVQWMTEAVQHHRNGRLAEAERLYRQVLQSDPKYPSALYFLGLMSHQTGKQEQAAKYLEDAVLVNPSEPTYRVILGNAYQALDRVEQAEQSYRSALRLAPGMAEAHGCLAAVLLATKRLEEAEATARRAVKLKPALSQAHLTLAAILKDRGQLDSAIRCLQEALKQGANPHTTLNNLGNYLVAANRLEEARGALEQSVQAAPEVPQAHWNLSLVYLMQGDFERGFAEQEWRLRHPGSGIRPFTQPMWDGKPLNGRSILLHAEQGFGDAIQFSRYAPLIPADGGRVIVECQPELKRLLSTLPDVSDVIATGDPPPHFDVQAPLLSLPYLFKTTPQTIPAAIPYLSADPALVERWRARMQLEPGKRHIGLVWAGSPTHRNDINRSINLEEFAPLAAVPDVRWFGLQMGHAASQTPPPGLNLTDLSPDIHDFADTAAILMNLDLLISVDTAAVHVAGALGRPAWVLLPLVIPDWRWGMTGETSPWYPGARLFRQQRGEAKTAAISRIASELTQPVRHPGTSQ